MSNTKAGSITSVNFPASIPQAISNQGLHRESLAVMGSDAVPKNNVFISKEEAYEEFRDGKGVEMDQALRENKGFY